MATHRSARKRARQAVKRQARNRHQRTRVRNAVKRARSSRESGDAGQAAEALRSAEGVIRQAASKGVLPRQRASRQISRLAKAASRLA